jgi:hypothetical protein
MKIGKSPEELNILIFQNNAFYSHQCHFTERHHHFQAASLHIHNWLKIFSFSFLQNLIKRMFYMLTMTMMQEMKKE